MERKKGEPKCEKHKQTDRREKEKRGSGWRGGWRGEVDQACSIRLIGGREGASPLPVANAHACGAGCIDSLSEGWALFSHQNPPPIFF